jgi:hypothetical protein
MDSGAEVLVSGSKPEPKRFDVFLNHSHADAEWVEGLAECLEDEKGLHVWLDKWVLVAGTSWQQAIKRALSDVAACAVCFGQHETRGWFEQEIERALNRQAQDASFRVIPVLLPGVDGTVVDDFAQLRTWADFREDAEHAVHVLAHSTRAS